MSSDSLIYRVNTRWTDNAITQDVIQDFRGERTTMWTNLVKLQDQGIREALIALGWTPPPERREGRQS